MRQKLGTLKLLKRGLKICGQEKKWDVYELFVVAVGFFSVSKSKFSLHFLGSASADGRGKALLTFPLHCLLPEMRMRQRRHRAGGFTRAGGSRNDPPKSRTGGGRRWDHHPGSDGEGTVPRTGCLSRLVAAGRLGLCSVSWG